MKIAVISDTHMGKHPSKITELVDRHFKDADMIIHAGDYTGSKVVNLLKKHNNFVGVYGNVDDDSVHKILNEKEIIRLCGYKIGIYHGYGNEKTTPDNAYNTFKNDKVDIIIFGHSHQPFIKTVGKVLMLNPGSPSFKKVARWHSYIILELEKDFINAQLRLF